MKSDRRIFYIALFAYIALSLCFTLTSGMRKTNSILGVAEDLAQCVVNNHIHHSGLVTAQNRSWAGGHIAVPQSDSRTHSSSHQQPQSEAEVKTLDSLQEQTQGMKTQ